MRRRLEDRIRELCRQAVDATDSDDVNPILAELQSALKEHTQRLRAMAADGLQTPGKPHSKKRKTD